MDPFGIILGNFNKIFLSAAAVSPASLFFGSLRGAAAASFRGLVSGPGYPFWLFCTENHLSTGNFHEFYILTKLAIEILRLFVYNVHCC